MKFLYLVLFLAFFISDSAAQSGPEFDRDSISVLNTPCDSGRDITRVVVHNRTSVQQGFDLIFTDEALLSSWFDSASVPIKNITRINSVILEPNDSMWFDVMHGGAEGLSLDTVMIRSYKGGSDTLVFYVTTQTIALVNSELSHNFGRIQTGDSVMIEHTIVNPSNRPFIVASIETYTTNWRIENISPGDTIESGATRTIKIVLPPKTNPGQYADLIRVFGICGSFVANVSAEVVLPGLHWKQAQIIDTMIGCRRGGEYIVEMHNTDTSDIRLIGIHFGGGASAQYWSFVTPPPQNVIVSPGESIQCTLSRVSQGGSISLYLTTEHTDELLSLSIWDLSASPAIKNFQDTIIFDIEEDEPIWFTAMLENRGTEPYQIQSMERIGSPLWTIELPDSSKSIGKAESQQIFTNFVGTSTPGEYAVTYKIRGIPCDTLLTQTLIARVGMTIAVSTKDKDDLRVFPTITSHELRIENSSMFTYSLVDLLGNTHLSGRPLTDSEILKVSNLPQGRYLLRIESGGRIQTYPVAIVR